MEWDFFVNASIVGKLGILVAFLPVVAATIYAVKPSERVLALIRPLSLAAIFGGLTTLTSGLGNVLIGIAATGSPADKATGFGLVTWQAIAAGTAESIFAFFAACGCQTITWLLVALGLRRAA